MTPSNLRLQKCDDCETVQYPQREICSVCLSCALTLSSVPDKGTVRALVKLHHSLDAFFLERLPWHIATVQMHCGPRVIAHAHPDLAPDDLVRVVTVEGNEGAGELAAVPAEGLFLAATRDDVKNGPTEAA